MSNIFREKMIFARPVLLGCILCLLTLVPQLTAWADGSSFSPRGPGGAGGIYTPSFSPFQEGLLFIGTDMGSALRSGDGGKNWELINWTNNLRFMQFSPKAVFFEDAAVWSSRFRRIRISRDNGVSWTRMEERPWGKEKVKQLCALPGSPDVLLVGTDKTLWRSEDMGESYQKVMDAAVAELLVIDDTVYTLTASGALLISRDRGQTWQSRPLIVNGESHQEGVWSFTGGKSGQEVVLFASLKKIGIVRSRDQGLSWQRLRPYVREKTLVMDKSQGRIVYAAQTGTANHNEVLRSTDGGETWEYVFRLEVSWSDKPYNDYNVAPSWVQTELHWGYYITDGGLAMDPFDPRHLVVTTQGDMYETRDGGENWRPIINKTFSVLDKEAPLRYESIGLEVTSCWQYYFDPFRKDTHYAAYSDIGFLRSDNAGKSWSWAAKGYPWRNTMYQIALDPEVPGRIYGAASSRHDIPHDMALSVTNPNARVHQGGVVVSNDHGQSWTVPYNPGGEGGLPKLACTTIALDLESPVNNRTLYAGLFGEDHLAGVYRSDDGGTTWAKKSQGLGIAPNMHVYRVAIHPKSGDLYCIITGLRKKGANYTVPGGVWKSSDKGESWRHISSGSDLNWQTTSLYLNPENENELFVTATSPPGHWSTGGLYRTRDDGTTWDHILTDRQIANAAGGDAWDHTMSFAVHPDDADLLYVGTTHHGLLYSRDGGSSWQSYEQFPFSTIQSISFVPDNHDRIIVTTFGGGIWEGPHLPQ